MRPVTTLWAFIRGDIENSEFESWLYKEDSLEQTFGREFYLQLISTNFKSNEQVYQIQLKLEETLRDLFPLSCECLSIADTDISDMGDERNENIFSTLKEIKNYGELIWWLSLHKFLICKQHWLVGQEERQNDVVCLKRLSQDESENIIKNNSWPGYFQTYEELLQLGKSHGRSVRFFEPENSSLYYTIVDLAKQRPGISIDEIASLLNLEKDVAITISQEAAVKENFTINFYP